MTSCVKVRVGIWVMNDGGYLLMRLFHVRQHSSVTQQWARDSVSDSRSVEELPAFTRIPDGEARRYWLNLRLTAWRDDYTGEYDEECEVLSMRRAG